MTKKVGLTDTGMLEMLERVEALYNMIDKDIEVASKKKQEEFKAKMAFEKQAEASGEIVTRKQIRVRSHPEIIDLKDPATGEVNTDFIEKMVMEYLSQDEEYSSAIEDHHEAHYAYQEAQLATMNIMEQLGAHKTQANLLSALLKYAS